MVDWMTEPRNMVSHLNIFLSFIRSNYTRQINWFSFVSFSSSSFSSAYSLATLTRQTVIWYHLVNSIWSYFNLIVFVRLHRHRVHVVSDGAEKVLSQNFHFLSFFEPFRSLFVSFFISQLHFHSIFQLIIQSYAIDAHFYLCLPIFPFADRMCICICCEMIVKLCGSAKRVERSGEKSTKHIKFRFSSFPLSFSVHTSARSEQQEKNYFSISNWNYFIRREQ